MRLARTKTLTGILLGASAVVLPIAMLTPAQGAPATATTAVAISSDPYTGGLGQHATEVEPDTISFGNKILAAHQTSRIFDGGSMNIGWEFSSNAGATWSHGFLNGITTTAGGTNPRASDPVVAYDAKSGTWLVQTLAFGGSTDKVLVARSHDGLTWTAAAVSTEFQAPTNSFDKPWIVCDNASASPHFGTCYGLIRDFNIAGGFALNRSIDGGATWSAQVSPAGGADGFAQLVVQPSGRVVVVYSTGSSSDLAAFVSTNGGVSWGSAVSGPSLPNYGTPNAAIRSPQLVSAEVDASGKIYALTTTCKYRASCTADDLVISTSSNGTTWTSTRIPTAALTTTVSALGGGIGVDPATSGTSAKLGVYFYQVSVASCQPATCQLSMKYTSSSDGGKTWTPAIRVGPLMKVTDLPSTTLGAMLGDYISTSVVAGRAYSVFPIAAPKVGSSFAESMSTVVGGLPIG